MIFKFKNTEFNNRIYKSLIKKKFLRMLRDLNHEYLSLEGGDSNSSEDDKY